MQAVIMAGGEGTRLRPLTCDRPKPLVAVCGKPVLTYALEHLTGHGVTEAWLTLGYMAGAIEREYGRGEELGLRVHPVVEPEPRGTAGSVAALPLDQGGPVLVLSGDALMDFDLQALLAFHRDRGSAVTLALARVPDPAAYGAVLTAPDGRIRRFLEKPTRDESFSDLVNTGVYVLEPEVLREVPPDQPFDFARDLFPRLLAAGVPLYGWEAGGYWCDIGDLNAYVQANLDLLQGRVRLRPPGREVAPGLWLDEGAELEPGVEVTGPVYLGPGSKVCRGARLEEGVVLGAGTLVEPFASLKRTVLGGRGRVGSRAALRGVAAGDEVRIGAGARLFQGVSLGSGVQVAAEAEVRPGVRLWPGRWVAPGAVADRNVVWAAGARTPLQDGCLVGRLGVEIAAEEALRYAGALSAALPRGPLLVGSDPGGMAPLLRELVTGGLRLAGRRVVDLGNTFGPVVPWAVAHRQAAGGLYVYREGPNLRLIPWQAGGRPLARTVLRKAEQAWRDQGLVLPPAEPGVREVWPDPLTPYCAHLGTGLDLQRLRSAQPLLALHAPAEWQPQLDAWADQLGVRLRRLEPGTAAAGAAGVGAGSAGTPGATANSLDAAVGAGPAEPDGKNPLLVAGLAPLGTGWWLAPPGGAPLPDERLQALLLLLQRDYTPAAEPLTIPATAPVALEAICRTWGRSCRRVDPAEQPAPDPLQALSRLLDHLVRTGQDLARLVAALPPMVVARRTVTMPWEGRPRLLRRLADRYGEGAQPLSGGLRLAGAGGCTITILPMPHQPICQIYAEAGETSAAEEAAESLSRLLGTLAREA